MLRKKGEPAVIVGGYIRKGGNASRIFNYESELPQTALSDKGQVFIVTTGINGETNGKAADEKFAGNVIEESYYSNPSQDISASLTSAFQDANTLLHELSNGNGQKIGAKCTAFVLRGEHGYLAQVGDYHVYRMRGGQFKRLTRDVNFVGGKESFALGFESHLNIYCREDLTLRSGDFYLLTNEPFDGEKTAEIRNALQSNSLKTACRKLSDLVGRHDTRRKTYVNIQLLRITPAFQEQSRSKQRGDFEIQRLWAPVILTLVLVILATLAYSFLDPENTNTENSPEVRKISILPPDTKTELQLRNQTELSLQQIPESTENSQPVKTAVRLSDVTQAAREIANNWNLSQLEKTDYEIRGDKIIFRATPAIKKAFYEGRSLSNIRIRVEAQLSKENQKGRFGIILGYQVMADSPYETYYLLSLFNEREFILQRYSGFKKTLLKRTAATFMASNGQRQNLQLEIQCRGDVIELYAAQRLVARWQVEEEVPHGKTGVFVSPDMEVTLSKFTVEPGVLSSK